MKPITVENEEKGERLDIWLARRSGLSRSRIQTLIRQNRVSGGNGTVLTPKTPVNAGEIYAIAEAVKIPGSAPAAENIPLEVIYEDEALLVINKPVGLVVHPAAGHWSGTLVNALMHHCGAQLAARGGIERLGIVHRLDKETSGVMVVAKKDTVHEALSRQFAARTTHKEYAALAWGRFRHSSGSWRGAIGRLPRHRKKMAGMGRGGREAWTDYRVENQGTDAALVSCVIHTGRTHQIRVHLSHAGHPVVGDPVYGRARRLPDGSLCPRQMLHARKLRLEHPLTRKDIEFEAPLPDDFLSVYRILSHHG